MNEWQPITDTAPAEGEVVLTRIDDGRGVRNEQRLKRQGRLWFTEDGKMYVYYVPTHYQPSTARNVGRVMGNGEVYERDGKRRIMVLMPDGLVGLLIDRKEGVDLTDGLSPNEMGDDWVRLGTFNEVYPHLSREP